MSKEQAENVEPHVICTIMSREHLLNIYCWYETYKAIGWWVAEIIGYQYIIFCLIIDLKKSESNSTFVQDFWYYVMVWSHPINLKSLTWFNRKIIAINYSREIAHLCHIYKEPQFSQNIK